MRVLEGEGTVVGMGSRSSRGIVVQVTDETGRPVEGAALSFHLPGDGPSGVFLSGLKTEVSTTGPDGKVSVYGIQWNSVPGPVQIRVTAAKGEARAGLIVSQYVSEKAVAETTSSKRLDAMLGGGGGGHKRRWALLLVLAAGVGGAAAVGLAQSKSTTAATPATGGGSGNTAPAIGTPTISVGHP